MRYSGPRRLLALLFTGLTLPAAHAGELPEPLGDDFQVSTEDMSEYYVQVDPAVAAQPGGGFTVVWAFHPQTYNGRSFAADGTPGTEFVVDTSGGYRNPAQLPALAADGEGELVAVWGTAVPGAAPTQPGIKGQRFTAEGEFLGESFVANSSLQSANGVPDVSRRSTGEFAVVWSSFDLAAGDSLNEIRGRLFGPDGEPSSDVFQVNTDTEDLQTDPTVALGEDGAFFVSWWSRSAGEDRAGVRGRFFGSDGQPATPEFRINFGTVGNQVVPVVAAAPNGRFLVAWQSDSSSGPDYYTPSIQGRVYAADATPVGTEFQVNTYSSGIQGRPAVAAARDGRFVVAWESEGSSGSDDDATSIQARVIDPYGSPLGQEFQVNTFTPGFQRSPDVTIGPDGELTVVWTHRGSEMGSPETSIRGRRFQLPPPLDVPPICADPRFLCLGEGARFLVEVEWTDFEGYDGVGRRVETARTVDSGLFYFFDESNWELLIKVLDGCGFNNRFWVFGAASTNVAYTITVTDRFTDVRRTYSNTLGTLAPALADIEAFATCDVP